ncbi:hypothetical protein [Leifsonia sp. Leaf264]|uniref:hypothetical protein n=1 Tax=Leifsonia sp. Leaf264 TaxID=1736314 RepID=UPI0006F1DB17|nr:hypothetical protein [Leifsonia sp. Leaf264]KQO96883.1 hypothetical protein ASF30_17585 [Leifsonia sp. Leaf264]
MADRISVAYDALTNDARRWDGVAARLDQAKASVANLDLGRGEFSFAAMDVADEYARLRALVVRLLEDGATQTRGAASALREIREDFEGTDAAIQASLAELWEPAD